MIFTRGQRLVALVESIGPVRGAFILSIVLSLIALSGAITPNDDGMLYVETARVYQSSGSEAAREYFDWLFLPVLMATVSSLTGLGLEASGYLLLTLFIAAICSLIVACCREMRPDTGWAAMAVVLTLPALNDYRDHIIREFGAWFLLFLAFWLLLRWVRHPNWGGALAVQILICAAGLFRPEVMVFLAVPVLWQLLTVRQEGALRRLMMFLVLPCVGLIGLAGMLASGHAGLSERIVEQFSAIDVGGKVARFNELVEKMSGSMPNRYAEKEAPTILFFGALGILFTKLVANFGLLVIPGILVLGRQRLSAFVAQCAPFALAFAVYLMLPAVFVLGRLFLSSRYVALLNLFAVPFVAVGLMLLFQRLRRWRIALVIVLLLMGLANVTSTTPPATRTAAAADWLKEQEVESSRVFVENPDIIYLVGWSRYGPQAQQIAGREAAVAALVSGEIDMALFDTPADAPDLLTWAEANGLRSIEEFSDRRKKTIRVFVRAADQTPGR